MPADTTHPDSTAQVRLCDLRVGQSARIHADTLDAEDAATIRAMGLRPNASVSLCRLGSPCIVRVDGRGGCGCRIGLARPLAERLLVTPLH
ncbi:MAG: FeoA family protein [Planctomycetota bacterium]